MQQVVATILEYLEQQHGSDPAAARLLDRIAVASGAAPHGLPAPPPHPAALERALSCMKRDSEPGLARIADVLASAAARLPWRLERGEYYLPGAAVSDSYRDGNMNATLLAADDFVMGLFLLVPGVDYLDHRHPAPEFYLNLTGPSSWRFDFGDWEVRSSRSVLWNEPGRVHALRTNDDPWLSVFAWLSDVDLPCEVVHDPGGVSGGV